MNRTLDISLILLVTLVTMLCTFHSALTYADEAADIARILELNDAYSEATRAWRAKEITRSQMQERQKAIQAESRRINSSYGRTGSAERRAWDQKVTQAKNAYTKQKRQDAQTAKAEAAAREREDRLAEQAAAAEAAAKQKAIAAAEAQAQSEARIAEQSKSPLAVTKLVIDFKPTNQMERDAFALAPLDNEMRTLLAEQTTLNRRLKLTPAEAERLALISTRLDILEQDKNTITSTYQDGGEALEDMMLLARALTGDLDDIKPEQATHMPAELQTMIADRAADLEQRLEAGRQQERQRQMKQWMDLIVGENGGKLALWVSILWGIAMSFGAPRGIARLSQDGKMLTLAGWKYSLTTVSGQLLDSQQRTEETTLIEASGGTGSIIGGQGYITPRQEAVTDTTTFDTLFLRDDNGVEHELELEDFGLRARIGNRVSILLAEGPRAAARPILAYNKDTRKHFLSDRVMRDLLKPSFIWALVNAALVFVIAAELALPLLDSGEVLGSVLVSTFCIYWIGGNRLTIAAIRARRFSSGKVSGQLAQQVSAA